MLKAKKGDALVMVGTVKGAFLLRSDKKRAKWDVSGPHFGGHEVYSLLYDARAGRQRIWAAAGSPHFGYTLRSSDDFGATWTNPEAAQVKFPESAKESVKRIWQLALGHPGEDDVLYAGVEPAALFKSTDGGKTWALNEALWNHPHRPKWQPGGGGLCMHTVLPDPSNPKRIHIAVSTAGVYRTDDGGQSWKAANKGVRAQFLPDKHPEFGQCVHKIARNASRPDTLFLQNHWGLYRSDDAGDSWKDIANGVPSDFGFAMAAHPYDRDVVYIVPIDSDEKRWVPEAKLRVYRTRNGGESWEPLARGLPQKGAYECVLRDGMATDRHDPAGVYFGTRSGKVFGSANEGNAWKLLVEGLPPVVCVKTGLVGPKA